MVDFEKMEREAEKFSSLQGSLEDFSRQMDRFIEATGLNKDFYRAAAIRMSSLSVLPYEWYHQFDWRNPRDTENIERFVSIYKRAGALLMGNVFAPQEILFSYQNVKVYWIALSNNPALPLHFSEWEMEREDLSNFAYATSKAICRWYDTTDMNAGFYRAIPGVDISRRGLLSQVAFTRIYNEDKWPRVTYEGIWPLSQPCLDWFQSILVSVGSRRVLTPPKPYRGGQPSYPEMKRWTENIRAQISPSNGDLENILLKFLGSITKDSIPNWMSIEHEWTSLLARSYRRNELVFFITQCQALAKISNKKFPRHLLSSIFDDGEYDVTTEIRLL